MWLGHTHTRMHSVANTPAAPCVMVGGDVCLHAPRELLEFVVYKTTDEAIVLQALLNGLALLAQLAECLKIEKNEISKQKEKHVIGI
jgi:hypothetical protein